MPTAIEWTQETWNPIVGCSVISPGCTNCYAMRLAGRLERMGSPIYAGLTHRTKAGDVWTGRVERSNWGQVRKPLGWAKPRLVFVNSMSDLFHEALPIADVDLVFAIMAQAAQHGFQVLTKRPDRMLAYCADPETPKRVWHAAGELRDALWALAQQGASWGGDLPWPLANVWLGTSVEDRARTERIGQLRQVPAAVRFLSCEPLLADLGAIDLTGIGWVIVGGESGPGARPMDPAWARSLRDQCTAGGVPFFMKQMAKRVEIPADLLIRQFPDVPALREAADA